MVSHSRKNVPVGVERDGYCGVSEQLLDEFGVHVRPDRQKGMVGQVTGDPSLASVDISQVRYSRKTSSTSGGTLMLVLNVWDMVDSFFGGTSKSYSPVRIRPSAIQRSWFEVV